MVGVVEEREDKVLLVVLWIHRTTNHFYLEILLKDFEFFNHEISHLWVSSELMLPVLMIRQRCATGASIWLPWWLACRP